MVSVVVISVVRSQVVCVILVCSMRILRLIVYVYLIIFFGKLRQRVNSLFFVSEVPLPHSSIG
jgi:hypothetical protein